MIHPSAIVADSAKIGDGVEIGPYCVIGEQVNIGPGCRLASHVVINGKTTIGEGNRFFQFSSIGEEPQDLKYKGESTELLIGDHNTFREFTTIHRGTGAGGGQTVIGNHGLFMAYVHIAHDCRVGDHVVFSNAASLAGHAEVGDYAILAGFSLVHQFGRVGEHAFSGMASALNRDLPPYVLASGNPVRAVGINKEGLKRRGFSEETIARLHKAFKLMFRSTNREQANEQLSALEQASAEVARLRAFVAASKRGVVR